MYIYIHIYIYRSYTVFVPCKHICVYMIMSMLVFQCTVQIIVGKYGLLVTCLYAQWICAEAVLDVNLMYQSILVDTFGPFIGPEIQSPIFHGRLEQLADEQFIGDMTDMTKYNQQKLTNVCSSSWQTSHGFAHLSSTQPKWPLLGPAAFAVNDSTPSSFYEKSTCHASFHLPTRSRESTE